MIIIYVSGSGRWPLIFDSSGADITDSQKYWPAAHFGLLETVVIRPVKDDFVPYTLSELQEFASFDLGLDSDWDTETNPKIRTITGFSVQEVTEVTVEADPDAGIEEESTTWAQIVCTVDFGTDEAKAFIQTSEYKPLKGELDGYRAGETRPGLIIKFPFLLLGRVIEGGTGTPNPVSDGNYNSAQVDALIATKVDQDLSANYSEQTTFTGTERFFIRDGSTSKQGTLTNAWLNVFQGLQSTNTLTQGTDNYITLGAIADYSVFKLLVKVYDSSGNYSVRNLTLSNDGSTALYTVDGGHDSASAIVNFDPDTQIDTDISGGNQRLKLSLSAGTNCTAKTVILNQI